MSARPRRMARHVTPRGGAGTAGPGAAGASRGAVITVGAGRTSLVSIRAGPTEAVAGSRPAQGEGGPSARLRRLPSAYSFAMRGWTPADRRGGVNLSPRPPPRNGEG